jgi:hypothetical protein
LNDWQGKDGPCGLFLWQEGEKRPIDQLADEEACLSGEEQRRFTLPERFLFYSYDCPHHQPIFAIGTTENEIWTSTTLHPFAVKT